MAFIYGREYSRQELMKCIGDVSQIAGARSCTLESGRAKGVGAVDIKTGGGLSFTVLTDRGLDIAWADYKGMAISYVSKTGVVSPAYFEPSGNDFLRGFFAGLLTTCGLTYMGAACEDQGVNLGLHGRISNIPAEDVCVSNEWQGDDFVMKVRGKVRESTVFGENMVLTREIESRMGENRLFIHDCVENCGYDRQPFMLLYHCNFGHPLLGKDTELILKETGVKARDAEAEKGLDICREFEMPTHGYSEQVFYHDLIPNEDGTVMATLFNKSIGESGFGIYLRFNKKQLPYMTEWKQMGEGDYAVGLEPATWYPEGRSRARERGELEFLEPGDIKSFDIEIGVIEKL